MLCEKNRKRDSDTEWRIYYLEWHLTVFLTTGTDPSLSLQDDAFRSPSLRQQILHIRFGWRLNVLYKDHGAGRQKELLAHVVRLMIPACRNDLIVKEYLACSRQLTADSFYLLTVFLTTAANPLLTLRMTSCHPPSFSTFSCQLTAISYRPSFPFRKIRVIYKNSGKRHSVFIFFHV